jgi:predicted DNA-binding transcriptional regulator YafY
VLAAAQLKVLAALPPELRGRASRVRQRFHLDAPGWFQEPEVAPHLQSIAEAVWSDRQLRLRYRRGGDEGPVVERTLDPLGIVSKAGVWYLVARAASIRTYRVSRILELAILPERFERPDEFDLAACWERSVAAYEDSLPSFPAIIRIRGDGLARLPNALGPVRARGAITAAGDPDEEGWLTLELCLEDFWHAELVLLQLGPHAEVLEPVELRRQIADVTRSMAERYR